MLPQSEKRITLKAAAELPILVKDDESPPASTTWRWCRFGVRGTKLEHEHRGGVLVTTAEAVERFIHALNNRTTDTSVPTPKQRQTQISATKARLAAAGLA